MSKKSMRVVLRRVGQRCLVSTHRLATGDEPPSGFCVDKREMDAICKKGEVYLLSGVNGFPVRRHPVIAGIMSSSTDVTHS